MTFYKNATSIGMLTMATVAAMSLLWVQNATAQSDMVQMLEQRFQAADTDHDGRLTRAEANAGMPRIAQRFDDIDVSHSGTITLQQIEAFLSKQRGG